MDSHGELEATTNPEPERIKLTRRETTNQFIQIAHDFKSTEDMLKESDNVLTQIADEKQLLYNQQPIWKKFLNEVKTYNRSSDLTERMGGNKLSLWSRLQMITILLITYRSNRASIELTPELKQKQALVADSRVKSRQRQDILIEELRNLAGDVIGEHQLTSLSYSPGGELPFNVAFNIAEPEEISPFRFDFDYLKLNYMTGKDLSQPLFIIPEDYSDDPILLLPENEIFEVDIEGKREPLLWQPKTTHTPHVIDTKSFDLSIS